MKRRNFMAMLAGGAACAVLPALGATQGEWLLMGMQDRIFPPGTWLGYINTQTRELRDKIVNERLFFNQRIRRLITANITRVNGSGATSTLMRGSKTTGRQTWMKDGKPWGWMKA